MESIPFHFDAVHGGFSHCAGLLHFGDDVLRFEYRTNIGGLGLKTGTREAEISIGEIQSIEFKRGWFAAKAMVRPRSLKTLDRIPGARDETLVIPFKRKDRSRAEYLISELNLQLSQARLAAASDLKI